MVTKKHRFVVLSSVILALFLSFVYVLADSIILTSTGTSSFSVNQTIVNTFNISVNNTGATEDMNLTNVTIIIPANFFFTGNNGTDATGVFSNSSQNLSWSADGLVMNLTKNYFWFNATATPGDYNITIVTYNLTSQVNSTNISVRVNDTVAPTVTFVTPINDANISGASYVINVTANDSYTYVYAVLFNVTNATGNVTILKVATNTSTTSWNATLNTTALADGLYNITAIANDTANNVNNSVLALNFRIDNTAPNQVNLSTGTTASSNLSQSYILANISSSDGVAVNTTLIKLYNSSGSLINSSTNTSNPAYVNFSGLSDGTYYLNATVNDSAGNTNSSVTRTITLDTTAPTITSVSSDPSTTSASITWTTGESSNSSVAWGTSTALTGTAVVNSTNVLSHSISLTGLAEGTVYYYNVTSCDSLGNCNTSGPNSFTTDTTPVTSSGSSGGSSPTFSVADNQLVQGYNKVLYKNWQMKFNVNNESHSLKLDSKTDTTATITVNSTPQTKTLAVGEEWKVNVNGDNYYDLLVKLNNLTLLGANVTVSKINEIIKVVVQEDKTVPSTTSAEESKEVKSFWSVKNAIIGAVVLVVVFGLILFLRRKK